MALDVYRKKRKFGVTPEPRGRKARGKGNRYVIQKHAATRLHYDLRLELDGVMKSWAVTRGPSLVPGEKRLAVETEDHPVEYNAFEGTIPKGEYGGGTVMIWDRGTLDAGRGPASRPQERPSRFLARRREAPRPLASRAHARPAGREAQQLAADQGHRRGRAHREGRRHPGRDAGLGRVRPLDRGDRGGQGQASASGIRTGAPRTMSRPARRAATCSSGQARPRERKAGAKSKTRPKKKSAHNAALPDFVPPSLATLRDKAPKRPAGCTRSSSTATACRRGSITARSSC